MTPNLPSTRALLSTRSAFRDRLWVALGVSLILSSMLAYAASRPVPVLAADATHFDVSVSGNQVAGVAFEVTITALDGSDGVDETYDGTATLSGDLGIAPDGTEPEYGAVGAFVDGVATGMVTAYRAEGPVDVSATDGSIEGTSVSFGVSPADLESTTLTPASDAIDADEGYRTYSAEGFDTYGNSRGTESVTFDISGDGDDTTMCTGADCGSRKTGNFLVEDTSSPDGGESELVVTPGALASFEIDTIGDQVAGTSFEVTITAYDQWDNIKTDYDGTAVLSGLAASPGCTDCTPDLAALPPSYGTVSFTDGEATVSVTAFDAGSSSLTVTDGSVTESSDAFDVDHAVTLGDFSIDTIVGAKTAGTGFSATVRAYDPYGNVKLDQSAGVFSGLATSPGCASPDCSPALVATAATYGSGSFVSGVKTTTVTAYNAQAGAAFTVTDGSVSETSGTFTVNPIAAARLLFAYAPLSFDGQPIDTEIGDKVYHVCTPAATGAADPCLSSSPPVQVLALDLYGNRALPTTVNVKVNNAGATYSGSTTNGIASITSPTAPVAPATSGAFSLTAAATGASSKVSRTVQAVNDLEACVGTACDNQAANQASNKQSSFGKITKGDQNFGGGNPVTLQTQYLAFDNGLCSNPTAKSVGQTTEIKVSGAGVSATAPDFSLVLVYPKDTIKAAGYTSRGPDAYNICLGATWIGTGSATPWLAKTSLTNSTLTNAVADGNGVYWGYVPECSQLTVVQRETNPCISLRTKQAATLRAAVVPSVMSAADFSALGMKDADVAIVISKPFPWDGKMGLK